MDFRLTEEQVMLQRTMREFAQKEVKPLSREYDAKVDPEDCFCWELVDKATELGVRTMAFSTQYGGGGLNMLSQAIILEELGAGDLGLSTLFAQHVNYVAEIESLCSKEQKDEFIPKIMEDDRFFIAQGLTEPDHGTDNQLPYDAPGAALSTTAVRKGDEYIINGEKQFITNAGISKLYIIIARTNKEVGVTKGASMFLVPHDTPGFTVGKAHNKLGRRILMNRELIFEDARVPAKYLVGKENGAFAMLLSQRPALLNSAAALLGCSRTMYEDALEYARNRVQGGIPIIGHATVGVKLAEMRMKLEAAKVFLWRCAWSYDNQFEYDRKMNFLAKAFINEVALTVLNHAVDVFGGMATEKTLPLEKYLRDVYTTLHAYGNPHMNLIKGMPSP
ncbi:acyl-CoA dehydrogenase family protein [Chloroflexota bacterium]